MKESYMIITYVIAQFTLTLREAFEAALIVSILLAYLVKTKKEKLKKYVWQGTYIAIFLGIILGGLVFLIYGTLSNVNKVLFESIASYLAVGVLTSMIYWMATKGKSIKVEIERKIEEILTKGIMISLLVFSFIIVFREVLETVLFLTPFLINSLDETLIGATLGIFVALFLSFGIFKLGMKLNLRNFFFFTSIILIFLAGGLAGYATHELIEYFEEIGIEIGFLGENAYNLNIEKENPLHHKNVIGSIFAVMFGYSIKAEWLRLIVHISYLTIALPLIFKVYKEK